MKVAIFEGAEVVRTAGKWTWPLVPDKKTGELKRAELADYTPRPQSEFPGWRNYLVMFWQEGYPVRAHSTIGTEAGTVRLCELFKARFYPAGTWEASPTLPGQSVHMAKVRESVIAEILGKPQAELAL